MKMLQPKLQAKLISLLSASQPSLPATEAATPFIFLQNYPTKLKILQNSCRKSEINQASAIQIFLKNSMKTDLHCSRIRNEEFKVFDKVTTNFGSRIPRPGFSLSKCRSEYYNYNVEKWFQSLRSAYAAHLSRHPGLNFGVLWLLLLNLMPSLHQRF